MTAPGHDDGLGPQVRELLRTEEGAIKIARAFLGLVRQVARNHGHTYAVVATRHALRQAGLPEALLIERDAYPEVP